ncbi:MAG: flagellar M-ring protein FliF C-terminal domain-containing protein [Tepidisphaeraceae bacterium]|jgi:flagellar biosynthesis/type III secretory pathway M-ring protein FliF/YscJ
MEFLKQQLARIAEQVAGLSATQKMLTASLVAIMIMTLLWWSNWAAQPEMEPVLNQSMSQDDIAVIVANLDAKGIPHRVAGDRVMVPSDRRLEVLAELGYSQALPRDFKTGFDDIVKQINWLDSPDKSDHMYLEAKQRTLSMVIRNFPGVSGAIVVIDPTNERRLDNTAIQPSAMVTITTNHSSHGSPKQLARSAADVVSGAAAGLLRSRINIIIDGLAYNVPDRDEDSLGGDDSIVDAQRQHEEFYRDKIRALFGDISGLMVSVTVKLDTSYRETRKHQVDPKSTVQLPIRTEEQTSESTAAMASAQEPGAAANVGVSLSPSAGGGGGNTSTSDSKQEFRTDNTQEDTVERQGPGQATVVTASVRVPRSYFVASYKNKNGGKDPDEAALTAFTDQELTHIRQDVKGCTGLTSDDAVIVGAYSDAPPQVIAGPGAAAPSAIGTLMSGHVKEIAVGILAAVSLFMVSMTVRKGAPAPVVVAAEPTPTPKLQVTTETVAGEVSGGGAMLDGVELDEEAVKAQQMVDQVQEMVQTNPDAAASLVKRWLTHP